MTILPSADAAYAAWRAGQLDWAAFPASAMADVLRLGKDHYLNRPIANMDYLVVTGTAVPADAQSAITFRQALSQAIDRSHIVDTVLAGKASPASGLVPALVPGSASNDGAMPCGACRFDPARARALLVASGVTMTGALPLFYQSGSGEEAVMDGVAQDLRTNLAIQAEATPVTTTAASPGDGPFPGVAHPVAGIAVVGIARVIGTPVPDDVLRGLLEAGSGENLSGYANPAFDTQVAKARAVTDPGARAAAYQQAERLVLQDLPIVPLLWERGVRLARLNEWSRLGMDAFGNPTLRTLARAG